MVPQHNDVNRSEVLNDFNLVNNFEYRLIAYGSFPYILFTVVQSSRITLDRPQCIAICSNFKMASLLLKNSIVVMRSILLQNLTITRLPTVGICHIKPLDKNLPSPSKMKSDMNYVCENSFSLYVCAI